MLLTPEEPIVTESDFHTADDLFNTLITLCKLASVSYHTIFRGVSNASYELIPTALRPDTYLWLGHSWSESGNLNSVAQIEGEIMTLAGFSRIVDKAGMRLSVPIKGSIIEYFLNLRIEYDEKESHHNWPPEELLPLLALAQHYGIPTRLLDWSGNPLIAAYFSVCKVRTEVEKVAIWALDGLGPLQFPTIRKVSGGSPLTLVEAPYADNPNLCAQMGIHTIFRTNMPLGRLSPEPPDRSPLDVLLGNIFKKHTRITLRKFTLPRSEAPKMLQLLANVNIFAAKLFPGYKGCADAFHEQRYW